MICVAEILSSIGNNIDPLIPELTENVSIESSGLKHHYSITFGAGPLWCS